VPLSEDLFRQIPLDFVGLSALRWDGNKSSQLTFNTTERGWETNQGTVPAGSSWRKVPIPTGIWGREGPQFQPVCEESAACLHAARGMGLDLHTAPGICRCSGYSNAGPLLPNLEVVDQVRVPSTLKPGPYVVQWRWDCEESDRKWSSRRDKTRLAPFHLLVLLGSASVACPLSENLERRLVRVQRFGPLARTSPSLRGEESCDRARSLCTRCP
jgi:hypothetical protein